jgi:hypothetical protein
VDEDGNGIVVDKFPKEVLRLGGIEFGIDNHIEPARNKSFTITELGVLVFKKSKKFGKGDERTPDSSKLLHIIGIHIGSVGMHIICHKREIICGKKF